MREGATGMERPLSRRRRRFSSIEISVETFGPWIAYTRC
jgi:hypothetical protein